MEEELAHYKGYAEYLREAAKREEWEADIDSIRRAGDLKYASDIIEEQAKQLEELETQAARLETMLTTAQSAAQTWKRLAEAAERDIVRMLESCDCEARHEYCARSQAPEGCDADECTGCAKWRGPCAENGGNENEAPTMAEKLTQFGEWVDHKCTVCGQLCVTVTPKGGGKLYIHTPFCPGCGAKMFGGVRND